MTKIDWDHEYSSGYTELVKYATRLVSNPHTAEELVQDTFLQAFRSLDKFSGGNFRGWLTVILRNKCMDYLRRSTRIQIGLFDDFAINQDFHADPRHFALSPEETYLKENLSGDLAKAFSQVNEPHREVLYLSVFHGMTPSEISKHLGIPSGTANSRKHKGIAQMRKLLA